MAKTRMVELENGEVSHINEREFPTLEEAKNHNEQWRSRNAPAFEAIELLSGGAIQYRIEYEVDGKWVPEEEVS